MQNVQPKIEWPRSAFRPLYDDRIDYEPVHGVPSQANRNQMANDGPIPSGVGLGGQVGQPGKE